MLKNLSGPCFVYALYDPRTRTVFYVGISSQPERRMKDHKSDPASPAYHRVRGIMSDGFRAEMKLLVKCPDRDMARAVEFEIVYEYPALLNRDRRPPVSSLASL